ncbi:Reticulocyte-binding protein 2-like protein a [Colletotrichum tropicale]|nr:Reticulocyte-binding protein 2-like protein a [Colletotrichum tropicale]
MSPYPFNDSSADAGDLMFPNLMERDLEWAESLSDALSVGTGPGFDYTVGASQWHNYQLSQDAWLGSIDEPAPQSSPSLVGPGAAGQAGEQPQIQWPIPAVPEEPMVMETDQPGQPFQPDLQPPSVVFPFGSANTQDKQSHNMNADAELVNAGATTMNEEFRALKDTVAQYTNEEPEITNAKAQDMNAETQTMNERPKTMNEEPQITNAEAQAMNGENQDMNPKAQTINGGPVRIDRGSGNIPDAQKKHLFIDFCDYMAWALIVRNARAALKSGQPASIPREIATMSVPASYCLYAKGHHELPPTPIEWTRHSKHGPACLPWELQLLNNGMREYMRKNPTSSPGNDRVRCVPLGYGRWEVRRNDDMRRTLSEDGLGPSYVWHEYGYEAGPSSSRNGVPPRQYSRRGASRLRRQGQTPSQPASGLSMQFQLPLDPQMQPVYEGRQQQQPQQQQVQQLQQQPQQQQSQQLQESQELQQAQQELRQLQLQVQQLQQQQEALQQVQQARQQLLQQLQESQELQQAQQELRQLQQQLQQQQQQQQPQQQQLWAQQLKQEQQEQGPQQLQQTQQQQ